MTQERWIVTGGAGYIGAHVTRALQGSGCEAVVIDDLSTGLSDRLDPATSWVLGSVLDRPLVRAVLEQFRPTGVIHLAAKKSPTESMANPLLYARENVGGLTSLLEAMGDAGVDRIVYSSSCSIYGAPDVDLVDEDHPPDPVSPYGESKLYGERLLQAAAAAYGLDVVILRYFNVVGAATPRLRDTGVYNLVPLVFQALRSGTPAQVFGADFGTPDGTCIRDYVDVEDLAATHVRAARSLATSPGVATYNVGRGRGSSVLEVLQVISEVAGCAVPYVVTNRRPGDPPRIVASVDRIHRDLGWQAERDLQSMIASAWAAGPDGGTESSERPGVVNG
jgi:UDP-glucose 4-epimerase